MIYLSKHQLFRILNTAKLLSCYYVDDADAVISDFAAGMWKKAILPHGTKLKEWVARHGRPDMVVRLMHDDHIPRLEKPMRTRKKNPLLPPLAFAPFSHYRLVERDGKLEPVEVLRSHWVGGFDNGSFNAERKDLGTEFAHAAMLMCERVASRPNFANYSYRDEMVCDGIEQLCQAGLLFDESKSENPFAYWTTVVTNRFIRRIKLENYERDYRDDMMIEAGVTPSLSKQEFFLTSQGDVGFTELEPHQKKSRAGRPKGETKPKRTKKAKDTTTKAPPPPVSPHLRAKVLKDYHEGQFLNAMMAKHKISRYKLKKIIDGETRMVETRVTTRKLTDEQIDDIIARAKSGVQAVTLAAEYNVSNCTVSYWVKKRG